MLNDDYMLSEESCDEEEPGKTALYRVKRLPWESEKLKRAKKALDDAYKQGLTKRAKDRVYQGKMPMSLLRGLRPNLMLNGQSMQ